MVIFLVITMYLDLHYYPTVHWTEPNFLEVIGNVKKGIAPQSE